MSEQAAPESQDLFLVLKRLDELPGKITQAMADGLREGLRTPQSYTGQMGGYGQQQQQQAGTTGSVDQASRNAEDREQKRINNQRFTDWSDPFGWASDVEQYNLNAARAQRAYEESITLEEHKEERPVLRGTGDVVHEYDDFFKEEKPRHPYEEYKTPIENEPALLPAGEQPEGDHDPLDDWRREMRRPYMPPLKLDPIPGFEMDFNPTGMADTGGHEYGLPEKFQKDEPPPEPAPPRPPEIDYSSPPEPEFETGKPFTGDRERGQNLPPYRLNENDYSYEAFEKDTFKNPDNLTNADGDQRRLIEEFLNRATEEDGSRHMETIVALLREIIGMGKEKNESDDPVKRAIGERIAELGGRAGGAFDELINNTASDNKASPRAAQGG